MRDGMAFGGGHLYRQYRLEHLVGEIRRPFGSYPLRGAEAADMPPSHIDHRYNQHAGHHRHGSDRHIDLGHITDGQPGENHIAPQVDILFEIGRHRLHVVAKAVGHLARGAGHRPRIAHLQHSFQHILAQKRLHRKIPARAHQRRGKKYHPVKTFQNDKERHQRPRGKSGVGMAR